MARPKKAPKLTVVSGAPGAGHNSASFSDEQMQALHLKNHVPSYEKALKAKKDADAAFKNVCKVIKSEGGSIAEVKRTIELRTPEGEAKLKAEIEQMLRVARWSGMAVGTQGDLFGPDRRSGVEKAAEEGKRAGMEGQSPKPPYPPGPEYDAYMDSWHKGQAAIFSIKKAEPDTPQVLRPEGNEPKGTDDFDEAANGGFAGSEPEMADEGAESDPPEEVDDDEIIDDVTDEDDQGGELPDDADIAEQQEEAL